MKANNNKVEVGGVTLTFKNVSAAEIFRRKISKGDISVDSSKAAPLSKDKVVIDRSVIKDIADDGRAKKASRNKAKDALK